MADIFNAYHFLNKELELGISSEKITRRERELKVEIGKESKNEDLTKDPDKWEFFLVPVGSDLMRAFKYFRDSQKLNISDEQLAALANKYMQTKGFRTENSAEPHTPAAAFLVKKSSSTHMVWAQGLLRNPLTVSDRHASTVEKPTSTASGDANNSNTDSNKPYARL